MKRAIIVDDDRVVRDIITAYAVHTTKFSGVDTVESAEEALALFEPGKYSLAVIDISLILMTGTELGYIMRQNDPDICILGITGYNKIQEEIDLRRVGFDSCFIKPFGYKEFFDYVRDLT